MFQSGQPVQPNLRIPEMDDGRHCGLCSFTGLQTVSISYQCECLCADILS